MVSFWQTGKESSGSNFQQSNWQKVQFNTDLLDQSHEYLYRNNLAYLNNSKSGIPNFFEVKGVDLFRVLVGLQGREDIWPPRNGQRRLRKI